MMGGRGVNLTTGHYRLGASDRELFMTIRKGVPGSEMPGSRLSQAEIWRIVTYVRRLGTAGADEKATGDPKAGRAIYDGKGGCAACHIVNGEGGLLGPELTEIGLRRSLNFLRDSIVHPSASIDPEYRSATVVTRDGAPISGLATRHAGADCSALLARQEESRHGTIPGAGLLQGVLPARYL